MGKEFKTATKLYYERAQLLYVVNNHVNNIELDLNRGVNPFGPIRRQDTKIGGCYLAFSPLLLYRGEG